MTIPVSYPSPYYVGELGRDRVHYGDACGRVANNKIRQGDEAVIAELEPGILRAEEAWAMHTGSLVRLVQGRQPDGRLAYFALPVPVEARQPKQPAPPVRYASPGR